MKLQSTAGPEHAEDFGSSITQADLAARAQPDVFDNLNKICSQSQRAPKDASAKDPPALLRMERRRDSRQMPSLRLRTRGTGLVSVNCFLNAHQFAQSLARLYQLRSSDSQSV